MNSKFIGGAIAAVGMVGLTTGSFVASAHIDDKTSSAKSILDWQGTSGAFVTAGLAGTALYELSQVAPGTRFKAAPASSGFVAALGVLALGAAAYGAVHAYTSRAEEH